MHVVDAERGERGEQVLDRLDRDRLAREARGELDAAEVRDGRGNLEAAEVRALEPDAVVGRRGLQRQRDLVAGMKSDSGAGDWTTEGSLRIHDLYWGWDSRSELSKRAATRKLVRVESINC